MDIGGGGRWRDVLTGFEEHAADDGEVGCEVGVGLAQDGADALAAGCACDGVGGRASGREDKDIDNKRGDRV